MSESSSSRGRREFLAASLLASASAAAASEGEGASPLKPPDFSGSITDVGGIRVGHFTDTRRPTGCTAILFDNGAVAGVDVRGGAPGTRETDLLNPLNSVQQVNAILLSGGSAFGLAAATGVVRYLEEQGVGYAVGDIRVPIVPAAVLFDLRVGDHKIRPDEEAGYRASQSASSGRVVEGCVGAGAGTMIGQMFGPKQAMKSGLGSASLRIGSTGLVVGALIAVNAAGDVLDPQSGSIVAGARTPDGKGFINSAAQLLNGYHVVAPHGGQTTIGVVATNARFDKAGATKIAQMAQDGLARSISPIHTPWDGDTMFAACTGSSDARAELGTIGAIAAEVVAQAVVRAVRAATGLPGLPAWRDLHA